jgi:tRNA/tmRNA/rRNA uracil-C5-methylase (TrmA/RlmC/RlmD family)
MQEVRLTPDADRALAVQYNAYMQNLDSGTRRKIQGKRQWGFKFLNLNERALRDIFVDEEGAYSLTEAGMAEAVTAAIKRAAGDRVCVVTDATACIGGNSINFAHHFQHVYAFEIDATRAKFLKHNTDCMCPPGSVTVFCGDYVREHASVKQDLVFLDPPWGGVHYQEQALDSLRLTLSGEDLAEVCRRIDAEFIAVKVPFNFAFSAFERDTSAFMLRLSSTSIGTTRSGHPSFVLLLLQRRR